MSKGNSAIKVLRTADKRIDKGWIQHEWSFRDPTTGQMFVCLEGALFGYCNATKHGLTEAQVRARDLVLEIIKERYGDAFISIPSFNDWPERTKEEIREVIKLAIIREETEELIREEAGLSDEVDKIMEDEDFDDLMKFIEDH
jgi:hypothetical protein